jgi:hypothetical protein
MKCIIAGSRSLAIKWDKIKLVSCAVHRSGWLNEITEIVSGGCRGIDLAGEMFAENYGIPVKRFLPEWENEGKAAGPKRNALMAEYADALIAIRGNSERSRGTTHMIKLAIDKGLKVFVMDIENAESEEFKVWTANC